MAAVFSIGGIQTPVQPHIKAGNSLGNALTEMAKLEP